MLYLMPVKGSLLGETNSLYLHLPSATRVWDVSVPPLEVLGHRFSPFASKVIEFHNLKARHGEMRMKSS